MGLGRVFKPRARVRRHFGSKERRLGLEVRLSTFSIPDSFLPFFFKKKKKKVFSLVFEEAEISSTIKWTRKPNQNQGSGSGFGSGRSV